MATDSARSTCRDFVSALASAAPTPGGGGAAALVGALGVALGNMVGSLTVGKRRYAGVEAELRGLMAKCDALQAALLDQVKADAEGFEPLARAYGIPADDPDRERRLEEASRTACEAPMRVMRLCCEAIDAIAVFAEKGARIAVSDAGCGAAICASALRSAALNVFINTRAMKDRAVADSLNAQADAMLAEYGARADSIYDGVRAKLR